MRSGHFLLACILTVALSSGMSPVPSPVELQPEGETPTSGSGTGELPVVGPDDNPVENREEAETLTDPDATMVDTDQSMSGDLEHLSYGPEEGVQPTGAEDALTAQVLPQGSFADATPLIRGTQRASGGDRYATAVAISKRLFPNGKADSVFIASGTSYSDGLALGALAAYAGGPLLLTSAQSLPPVVHDEIQRLTPKTIYIGGGTGAVGANVERQLSLLSTEIVRLAGTDRYGTARAIAGEFPAGSPVAISTGTDFPDALVAASATPKLGGGPVLLTRGFKYSPDLGDALAESLPTSVLIVGGTWSKSDLSSITQKSGVTPTLVSGKDRYATSAAVSKQIWGGPTPTVIYATGATYADAMAGVPASTAYSAPILLSKQDCRTKEVAEMGAVQSRVLNLGGTAVLTANAYSLTCPVLPSVVSQSGGFYRFNMTHQAQQNGYYCGPATAQMILSRLGYTTSRTGLALSQKNLARDEFLRTDYNRRTLYADAQMSVGINAWTGSSHYGRQPTPTTAQFRNAVSSSFTSTGRPVIVDTQEYSGGAHYNGHPAYSTFSHLMPVEGYNASAGTIIMLDSASHFYGPSQASFVHDLAGFTKYLQRYGIYY